MRPVKRKNLVIGEIYADYPDPEDAEILKYVGRSEETNGHRFEHIAGENRYPILEDGLIGFSDLRENDLFYQIEEGDLFCQIYQTL